MGNCLETCSRYQQQQQQQHKAEPKGRGGSIKEEGVGKGSLKVKVVLTKEELEWLMFQLKEKGDKKCLEDLLEKLEEGRRRTEAWKPSLESIMESPEVHEMDR